MEIEYIEAIEFFSNGHAQVIVNCSSDVDTCVITTNFNKYKIIIDPKIRCCEAIEIFILGQDFLRVDENRFINAQLVCVVRMNERDEKLKPFYEKLAIHEKGNCQFFEFETSKGNFYIQASVWYCLWHDKYCPHDVDYVIEPRKI